MVTAVGPTSSISAVATDRMRAWTTAESDFVGRAMPKPKRSVEGDGLRRHAGQFELIVWGTHDHSPSAVQPHEQPCSQLLISQVVPGVQLPNELTGATGVQKNGQL